MPNQATEPAERKILQGKEVSEEETEEAEEPLPDGTVNYALLGRSGVDTKLGLKYCEQDEELYQSLLSQYCTEAPEKKAKLDEYLNAKDLKNYTILIHAVKSTSLMIGAASLSGKAKALELAAKEGNEGFLELHHDEMLQEYNGVTQAIERSMSIGDAQEEVFEYYPGGDEN